MPSRAPYATRTTRETPLVRNELDFGSINCANEVRVSFRLDEEGLGYFEYHPPEDYDMPVRVKNSTFARSISPLDAVPTEKIATINRDIELFSGGNEALEQILRTEYREGLVVSSTENVSHYAHLLHRMSDEDEYTLRESVGRALEVDPELRECLYLSHLAVASPEQKIKVLLSLPGLGSTEISRRSFSLNHSQNALLDEAMMSQVRQAIVGADGEVYAERQYVRQPRLRAVEQFENTDLSGNGRSVIFTTKYDIGTVPADDGEVATFRTRDKFMVAINDDLMRRKIKKAQAKNANPAEAMLALQNDPEFIKYCLDQKHAPDAIKLSSIIYAFVPQQVAERPQYQAETWRQSIKEFVERDYELMLAKDSEINQDELQLKSGALRYAASVEDLSAAKRRIDRFTNQFKYVPDMLDIVEYFPADCYEYDVAVAALLRTIRQRDSRTI